MDTTANDSRRAICNDATGTRHIVDEGARFARAAGNREVQKLIAGLEDLVSRVVEAADPEIAQAHASVAHAQKREAGHRR